MRGRDLKDVPSNQKTKTKTPQKITSYHSLRPIVHKSNNNPRVKKNQENSPSRSFIYWHTYDMYIYRSVYKYLYVYVCRRVFVCIYVSERIKSLVFKLSVVIRLRLGEVSR